VAGLGRFIVEIEPDIFEVPSQDSKLTYTVRYGGLIETCTCKDYGYRKVACVHLLTVGAVKAARRRRRPRRHTFVCSSCFERFPLADSIVVGPDEAGLSLFDEGELLCKPCGRSQGVR